MFAIPTSCIKVMCGSFNHGLSGSISCRGVSVSFLCMFIFMFMFMFNEFNISINTGTPSSVRLTSLPLTKTMKDGTVFMFNFFVISEFSSQSTDIHAMFGFLDLNFMTSGTHSLHAMHHFV